MFIHCENTGCKHYWEDSCTRDLGNDRASINSEGKCISFEPGVSDFYNERRKVCGGCKNYVDGDCTRQIEVQADTPCTECELEFVGSSNIQDELEAKAIDMNRLSTCEIRICNNKTGDILYKDLTIAEIAVLIKHLPNQMWWSEALKTNNYC